MPRGTVSRFRVSLTARRQDTLTTASSPPGPTPRQSRDPETRWSRLCRTYL